MAKISMSLLLLAMKLTKKEDVSERTTDMCARVRARAAIVISMDCKILGMELVFSCVRVNTYTEYLVG